MGNVAIFKQQGAVATTGKRELSDLAKTLAKSTTTRRIQTNTNGTFRRIINGEQIGNAIRGEINVIIVGALPKVSRTYYEAEYDPDNTGDIFGLEPYYIRRSEAEELWEKRQQE